MQGYVPRALVVGQAGVLALLFLGSAELLLNRKLSLPVSRMWQWWVSRSNNAVVIFSSPNTRLHSEKLKLVVSITLVFSYSFESR